MKYNDIAIIGMSGIFPLADNLEEFHENLVNSKDCIREIPEKRKEQLNLDKEKEYVKLGYLEDIDYFDHEYFNISTIEADIMSPEQRISLELAAEAILQAGYSIENFKGSKCSVYFTTAESSYGRKIKRKTGTAELGSLSSMLTGKINYYLDLQGPGIVYDTGCSSVLVALHEACIHLMLNETEYSLVGGISINLDIPEANANGYDVLGIGSPTYHSNSFGEKADGVGVGEGGGCILLKTLENAKRDKDNILGVIKCGNINGDGARSSSVTIPSIEGQRQVIEDAWRDIDVSNINEFEAHGIGTAIGDTVEANSIMYCLDKYGISEGEVKLSSVKSNIGHLGMAAGISGILKILVGFNHNESYPILNFSKPNKNIDFSNSPLEPLKEIYKWSKDEKRMVGINSFGLNGTNAHLVLENYLDNSNDSNNNLRSLVKISALNEESFYGYKERLVKFLQNNNTNYLDDVYTLNSGRDDYEVRRMFSANSKEELLHELETIEPYKSAKKQKIIFTLKLEHRENNNINDIKSLVPGIEEFLESYTNSKDYNLKYAFYKLFKKLQIKADLLLADIPCRTLIEVINGKKSKEQLIEAAKLPVDDDFSKLINIIHKEASKNEEVILVDFGTNNKLKNESWESNVKVYQITNSKDLEEFFINYYNNGGNICWDAFYGQNKRKKQGLPGYYFSKVSHFQKLKSDKIQKDKDVKKENKANNEKSHENLNENTEIDEAKATLKGIWQRLFETDEEISYDEDFFDYGGNSLKIQQMSTEINSKFNMEFDIYEIYDNPTIEDLAEKIIEEKNS